MAKETSQQPGGADSDFEEFFGPLSKKIEENDSPEEDVRKETDPEEDIATIRPPAAEVKPATGPSTKEKTTPIVTYDEKNDQTSVELNRNHENFNAHFRTVMDIRKRYGFLIQQKIDGEKLIITYEKDNSKRENE